ncbi:hypothetical protein GCAAIG_05645 [Candidatus Electronema halotolerans]
MDILKTVRQAIKGFCVEFVNHPYLCYTEHGQHALFYTRLYNLLPEEERYVSYQNQRVCILQKEYPTATNLGKPKRQHWDVSVLATLPTNKLTREGYDYLPLLASIEFGLNATEEHLKDDIERLGHPDANVMQGFIVHLYRLSPSGHQFSRRDLSNKTKNMLTPQQVGDLTVGRSVEIYYGMADSTGKYQSGVWHISGDNVEPLRP